MPRNLITSSEPLTRRGRNTVTTSGEAGLPSFVWVELMTQVKLTGSFRGWFKDTSLQPGVNAALNLVGVVVS